ncbi:MAG: DUF2357 domain-containing protein [Puniceicoccales bacterium]|nr:DUF2357 domain-containing protein [Puniceicoccales bacterium]
MEEIFRRPHSLLKLEIEKVNVCRAKRIARKSFQHLSAHTEDWLHKSLVSFRPGRILHEELNENPDVYENRFTVHFVKRCLVRLEARLKEVRDLGEFMDRYGRLLTDKEGNSDYWKKCWRKIQRNLTLMGAVYKDENYQHNKENSDVLKSAGEKLKQMRQRLRQLRQQPLWEAVDSRIKPEYHDTNVFTDGRHYRYVRRLWTKFVSENDSEESEEKKSHREQEIVRALRTYTCSLFAYCLKTEGYLGFKLTGTFDNFKAKHENPLFPEFRFHSDERKTTLIIGNGENAREIRLLTIGNNPGHAEQLTGQLKEENAWILYFQADDPEADDGAFLGGKNDRFIFVSPYDPDSCERIAAFIRRFVLEYYLKKIAEPHPFPNALSRYAVDFSQCLGCIAVEKSTYVFTSLPEKAILADAIKEKMMAREPRVRRDGLENEINRFLSEMNTRLNELKGNVSCPICGAHFSRYPIDLRSLYLECRECEFRLSKDSNGKVLLSKKGLLDADKGKWGMDYMEFNIHEL